MTTRKIKVLVSGACGKMGTEVVKAVSKEADMEIVALVDICDALELHATTLLEEQAKHITLESDLQAAIDKAKPDVAVDFTNPASVYENTKILLKNKVRPVIGTTGLAESQINEFKQLAEESNVGCLIVPNFAVGAVLMMQFAQKAAQYFNHSEIIELHHNKKLDAPSGTAIKTAQLMEKEQESFAVTNVDDKETIKGARGASTDKNIHIHSVRLPGLVAHQEVYFASPGQLLTIRHDSFDRVCFMPGVVLSVRKAMEQNELIYGLENIL